MEKPNEMSRPSDELRALGDWLECRGEREAARETRRVAEGLGAWEAVARRAGSALALHHDIRNALTGVLGNAQLLLLSPAGELPDARRRLEALIREAERIRDMAETLGRARTELRVQEAAAGAAEPGA